MTHLYPADPHDRPQGGSRGLAGWRRLAVLALASVLALYTVNSASAQGVWVTLPAKPTAAAKLGAAAADCPRGWKGTCVYAVAGSGAETTLEAYNPAKGTWIRLPDLLSPARSSVASTTADCPGEKPGDCVYATGGTTGGSNRLNHHEAYSSRMNAWLSLRPMPTARMNAGAATAPCPKGYGLRGTCVFVTGGDAGTPTATVEAYSPETGTWATLPPLQQARAFHGSAAAACPSGLGLKGVCVYAFGGVDTTATLKTAEVYSPATDTWQYLPDLPAPRRGLGAAAAPCPEGAKGGCVYAVGGLNAAAEPVATQEAYSPAGNAWLVLPSMPTPRNELGVAAAPCSKSTKRHCVYAVGGFLSFNSDPTNVTEAFAIEHPHGRPKPPSKPKPAPTEGDWDDISGRAESRWGDQSAVQ
ncbi:Kelch repeat-containing protein [Streptomyces sp. IBSNAI002]|uniref:Kelch repeat-containing protein n=1 Tax=Streptomyces sp. IBSNAI002 TaxID=3457500 RepID=UPI003FD3166D